MSIVPTTYEEWEHCITVECGIPLTTAYVSDRIEALEKAGDYQTKKFIDRWGEAHHARVLEWFRQA
ncbi:MAG: hypothetical protein AAGE83_16735, partial [Pseudomonadota bacterium]